MDQYDDVDGFLRVVPDSKNNVSSRSKSIIGYACGLFRRVTDENQVIAVKRTRFLLSNTQQR